MFSTSASASTCSPSRQPRHEKKAGPRGSSVQNQSINLRVLTKQLYVAKGPKKGRKRGGGKGYAMRTAALIPQLAVGKSLGRKGRAKKTSPAKKTIAKAASKSKTKATPKSKATTKATPKSKATTKATPKSTGREVPLPLRPVGSYADGTPRGFSRHAQSRRRRQRRPRRRFTTRDLTALTTTASP